MKLTFNIGQFEPTDDNVIVQPGPIKKINTVVITPKESKMDVKGEKVQSVEKGYEKQPTDLRIGKILAVSSKIQDPQYTVGDWVVYKTNGAFITKLDLLAKKSDDDKCPIVMKGFGILTKVNIDE